LSIRFQADADLNFDIVKAVRQQEPAIDFASAADSHLRGIKDPELLERAAVDNRVLLSHDRRTMLNHFRDRLALGKSSPGLLVVSQDAPIGPVVESLVVFWSVSDPAELRDQAYHLPSLIRHVFPR
jgi:Domain of unknown function (DUF5615)